MAGEVRYFIDGQWIPKSQLPYSIVKAYEDGMLGAQPQVDPATGSAIYSDDGQIQFEGVPMSSFEGDGGQDTMMGGSGADRTLSGYRENLPGVDYQMQGRRRLPVSDSLLPVLQAAAADAGVTALRVTSGGQAAKGTGGPRTGSVRHDHGNAADFQLIVDGRVLDFTNAEDRPIFEKFVQTAAALGATGIGAGVGYMGPRTIHVGFGTPAVWGPGNSSATAPKWLKTAYEAGRASPLAVDDVLARSAARLAPPAPLDSPALGARLAAGDEAPPSYPSVQEAAKLLASLGYEGPDAVMRFQADNMGLAGEGGRTSPEFFAALANPDLLGGMGISPPERPGWARGVDATTMANAPPTGIAQAARLAEPNPNPSDLGGTVPNPPMRPGGVGLGDRTVPKEAVGVPSPRPRPAAGPAAPQEAAAGYRRLRLGDRGPDVKGVQSQLLAAGFDPGGLDGAYGPRTARAVMQFQQQQEEAAPGSVGGKVDAIAGPFTQSRLYDVTQNSTWGSMGGVNDMFSASDLAEGFTPSAIEMGRTLGMPADDRKIDDFSPAGDRPPAPPPSFAARLNARRTLGGTPPVNITPAEDTARAERVLGATPPGNEFTNLSIERPRPLAAKPWSGNGQFTRLGAPIEAERMAYINDMGGGEGVTLGTPPPGSREPAPLSPSTVISSLGGTGSSGLGMAGPGGPGMGGGSSSSFGGTDDDEDTGPSGYNESFSTTGWL